MSEASRPSYRKITVSCRCGHHFQTRTTVGEDFGIEICSQCHPVFGARGTMTTLQSTLATESNDNRVGSWSNGLTFSHVSVEQ